MWKAASYYSVCLRHVLSHRTFSGRRRGRGSAQMEGTILSTTTARELLSAGSTTPSRDFHKMLQ